MNFEFEGNKESNLKSGNSKTGMMKGYAADTGSIGNFNLFSNKPTFDSTFEIPNNFTPARVNKSFIDSKQYPLISGGEPKNSEMSKNLIGKRANLFGVEKSSGNFGFNKNPKKHGALFMSKSNHSLISNKPSKFDLDNHTKFSKDQMMDVYLEDASGSKMSNSRFRIETEKED